MNHQRTIRSRANIDYYKVSNRCGIVDDFRTFAQLLKAQTSQYPTFELLILPRNSLSHIQKAL